MFSSSGENRKRKNKKKFFLFLFLTIIGLLQICKFYHHVHDFFDRQSKRSRKSSNAVLSSLSESSLFFCDFAFIISSFLFCNSFIWDHRCLELNTVGEKIYPKMYKLKQTMNERINSIKKRKPPPPPPP